MLTAEGLAQGRQIGILGLLGFESHRALENAGMQDFLNIGEGVTALSQELEMVSGGGSNTRRNGKGQGSH